MILKRLGTLGGSVAHVEMFLREILMYETIDDRITYIPNITDKITHLWIKIIG